jgi:Tol biopolymer transport system component
VPGLAPAPAARLFAEGVVSTEEDEVNGSFSPDGTEYYFARVNPYTTSPRWGVLFVTRWRDGAWTAPEVLKISGSGLDLSPRVAPDGRTLYFSSTRPAPGSSARLLRIWAAERVGSDWGEPRALPPPVNTEKDWNFSPSVTSDGTLYFASTRDGGDHTHVYRARRAGADAGANAGVTYVEPEKLGPEVNSDVNEADPFVSPDERVLIFSSTGDGPPTDRDRAETVKGGGVLYARGDLYASTSTGSAGKWTKARHLEHGVNTFADESSPSLTPDGRFLFFTSERSPFSIPLSRPMDAREIDRALRSTLNGHGNVFYVGMEALGLHPAERPR